MRINLIDRNVSFKCTCAACRLLAEIPMKACSDCCFSNGGHQFAAASNNAIAVYNTFTCELMGTLRWLFLWPAMYLMPLSRRCTALFSD